MAKLGGPSASVDHASAHRRSEHAEAILRRAADKGFRLERVAVALGLDSVTFQRIREKIEGQTPSHRNGSS